MLVSNMNGLWRALVAADERQDDDIALFALKVVDSG